MQQNNQMFQPQAMPEHAVPFPPSAPINQMHEIVPINPVDGFSVRRPVPQPMPVPLKTGWSSELFDCMDDPMNTLITAFFPCVTFGQVAEIIDEGHTSCGTSGMLFGAIWFFIALPFILSCTYMTKLHSKFGLPESPSPDWVTHFFCEWCALCQEYRELQSRGLDPSIGMLLKKNSFMYHFS
ncbi:hypothetical protein EZV62_024013 [Acer yangbiense]|uniref:Uncharacterized protein n=1 Tax=Acer yangbiense TaxID=1000413 RepID=A0A5C7H447_9ROSI|nr:hypothetical protein EZV62_024013 [Acer yangbiense]